MTHDRQRPPGAKAKPMAAVMQVAMRATTTVAMPAVIRVRPPAPKVLTTGLSYPARLAAPADALAGAEL